MLYVFTMFMRVEGVYTAPFGKAVCAISIMFLYKEWFSIRRKRKSRARLLIDVAHLYSYQSLGYALLRLACFAQAIELHAQRLDCIS